jgi:hypothetical protein
VTLAGSTWTAYAGLLALTGTPGAQIFLIAGLLIVSIGNIIKMFKSTDYQEFVKHCYWGKLYGEGAFTPEWATKKFSDWKRGDGGLDDYDAQFVALVNLICRFEIEEGGPREVELKMGFMPSRASLELHYLEKWKGAADSRDLTDRAMIETAAGGKPPVVTASKFQVVSGGSRTFKVRPSVSMTTKPLTVEYELPDGPTMDMKNPELDSIWLEVQLVMKFGKEEFHVPHRKPARITLS